MKERARQTARLERTGKDNSIMKKSNRKNNSVGKRFFFIATLLCAFSLSGCSTAIQSLADGTGQMLDSLTKADDGRLKDRLLEAYGALLDEAGSTVLTPESRLKGRLKKGGDDYTGSYEADYSDFTGTELLFGGTTLEREGGSTLSIRCTLSLENGSAAVFLRSGSDDPVVLLSESGAYTGTVEADGASTYIGVWGDHADGSVSIEIE